jgi:hypothetical protein
MEHGESSERQTNNEERVDAGKMRENAAALSDNAGAPGPQARKQSRPLPLPSL